MIQHGVMVIQQHLNVFKTDFDSANCTLITHQFRWFYRDLECLLLQRFNGDLHFER